MTHPLPNTSRRLELHWPAAGFSRSGERIRRVAERRRAFTILELLVALGVIVVLVVLVLPAIQRAREAARQVQCKNNLRQIGIAIHSYHATTNCLPPGWILEVPFDRESHNGWGWLAMLLPEMDQAVLFNGINFGHHVANAANETARLTIVGAFVCPSDHTATRVPLFRKNSGGASLSGVGRSAHSARWPGVPTGVVFFEVAGANYAGVYGTTDPDDVPAAVGDGVFSLNSSARLADVLDGTAQTLFVGERSASRMGTTWAGMHADEEEGAERVIGFADHTPNHVDADEAEFSSRHPGGAHFLLGDGSVRFLSDHIDRAVYRALATRSGQEPVGRAEF